METNDHRPLVLIVDDELANLRTYLRMFRKDFEMHHARSGKEAVELLYAHRFDVAFVDYAMPEMDGVEFLRQAMDIQPAMLRVLVTAHADLDRVREAKNQGLVAHIISKPWDHDEILHWVRQCSPRYLQASVGSECDDELDAPCRS